MRALDALHVVAYERQASAALDRCQESRAESAREQEAARRNDRAPDALGLSARRAARPRLIATSVTLTSPRGDGHEPSDAVEVIDLGCRGPDGEHLKRKASIQAVDARLARQTLHELASQMLLDGPVPIHELPPERHVLESTMKHPGRRQVRLRKQPAIGLEVV